MSFFFFFLIKTTANDSLLNHNNNNNVLTVKSSEFPIKVNDSASAIKAVVFIPNIFAYIYFHALVYQ